METYKEKTLEEIKVMYTPERVEQELVRLVNTVKAEMSKEYAADWNKDYVPLKPWQYVQAAPDAFYLGEYIEYKNRQSTKEDYQKAVSKLTPRELELIKSY